MDLVVFSVDGQRFALALEAVERVVAAAFATPLPGAPPGVHGLLDVGGRLVPVLSLRQRFGLPERTIAPRDRILLARARGRDIALVVDDADSVITLDEAAVDPLPPLLPGVVHVRGATASEAGLVLIQDLEQLLSAQDVESLDAALAREAADGAA